MLLTKQILDELGAEFPENVLSCKVQSYAKPTDGGKKATRYNAGSALLVTYVSHTDVAARLDGVCSTHDLDWEFTETRSWIDKQSKDDGSDDDDGKVTYCCEGKLTISGIVNDHLIAVSRVGIGEGKAYKDAYSDALKRAAVLFGIARSLYDQDNLWIPWKPEYYYKKFSLREAKDLSASNRGGGNYSNNSQAPTQRGNAARSESTARSGKTVEDLNSKDSKTLASSPWNSILSSETKGLWNKLKADDAMKQTFMKEFGKPLTPDTHREFNEFLKAKIQ